MAEIIGNNTQNRIKVSNTMAEYYSDLTKRYMEQAAAYAAECNQNVANSNEQFLAITQILNDIPTTTAQILTEIQECGESQIADIQSEIFDNENFIIVSQDLKGANTIGIVAANITSVVTVKNNITSVNVVAENISKINTIYNNISNLNLVANNINNINAVKNNEANINSIISNLPKINEIINNKASINTVASNISNIDNVSNKIPVLENIVENQENILTCAARIDDIQRLSSEFDRFKDLTLEIMNYENGNYQKNENDILNGNNDLETTNGNIRNLEKEDFILLLEIPTILNTLSNRILALETCINGN